jgi:hypothetical protein
VRSISVPTGARQGTLCGALPGLLGSTGWARLADRERRYESVAAWLRKLTWKTFWRDPLSNDSGGVFRTGTRNTWTDQHRPLRAEPLPGRVHLATGNRIFRCLLHYMSISLGQLFRLTGWSLLTAAWIVLLARDLVFRGYSLLFDLGCIATMVLLGRCLISAGRILSSGDGWYEIRPGNPFVLYLRSFEDDGVAHFDIMRGLLRSSCQERRSRKNL